MLVPRKKIEIEMIVSGAAPLKSNTEFKRRSDLFKKSFRTDSKGFMQKRNNFSGCRFANSDNGNLARLDNRGFNIRMKLLESERSQITGSAAAQNPYRFNFSRRIFRKIQKTEIKGLFNLVSNFAQLVSLCTTLETFAISVIRTPAFSPPVLKQPPFV